jgi:hypothetical protein
VTGITPLKKKRVENRCPGSMDEMKVAFEGICRKRARFDPDGSWERAEGEELL